MELSQDWIIPLFVVNGRGSVSDHKSLIYLLVVHVKQKYDRELMTKSVISIRSMSIPLLDKVMSRNQ